MTDTRAVSDDNSMEQEDLGGDRRKQFFRLSILSSVYLVVLAALVGQKATSLECS